MLKGGQPDRLPLVPITMMFAADRLGVKYGEYARNHEVLVEGQIRTAEEFGFDHVSVISDPAREAEDYGAHVQWYEDQPPALVEEDSLLAEKGKLTALKPIDPLGGGRMHDRIRAIELLKRRVGAEKFVEGWVEGPCAEAADLRGINRLMFDFHDDPVFVEELFGFVVENAIAFAGTQIVAGADIIGVGDAAASLVGPRLYEKFVWPYEKKLVDGIHAAGGRVRLHICGNTRRILAGMGKLGSELVDLDYPVALRQAREIIGPDQALAGNIEPVGALRNGAPQSVAQAVANCHREAGPRYVVSAGCEVVRDTPIANLQALCEYAKSHRCGGEYTL